MAEVTPKKIYLKDVNKSVRGKLGKKQFNREDAKEITDTVLDIIRESLERGTDVSLKGFGAFRIRERKARKRYNPNQNCLNNRKKEKILLHPPRRYIVFVPSAGLEKAVKGLKQGGGAVKRDR